MARTNDWQREVREAVRKENWSLTGPNCIVKVVALQRPVLSTADGYITTGKFLVGKFPSQIERELGRL
jgi:hypothetical protein